MKAHRRASGNTLSGANVEVSATGETRTKCVTGLTCMFCDRSVRKSIGRNGMVHNSRLHLFRRNYIYIYTFGPFLLFFSLEKHYILFYLFLYMPFNYSLSLRAQFHPTGSGSSSRGFYDLSILHWLGVQCFIHVYIFLFFFKKIII